MKVIRRESDSAGACWVSGCGPLDAFGTGMDADTAVLAVPAPRPPPDGEAQL
ncbi:hypothetical protein ACH40D_06175 [Streptomyces olivaceoviridis]|uniref:hypothetical protein n=1 Tax=Streptomyces TaxID=1883 RepID=UPI000A88AC61|nr:hypothetical protein [Streptomyces corchorusii]